MSSPIANSPPSTPTPKTPPQDFPTRHLSFCTHRSQSQTQPFKRPPPLSKRPLTPSRLRYITKASPNSNSNSSSKYLNVPTTVPRTSNDARLRLKIAHRQKRCENSPDSPRIGVEDLQRFADACGISLGSVCEEAVHDTFEIQVSGCGEVARTPRREGDRSQEKSR